MKRIKDPVHGYIEIPDPFVTHLVDTSIFQRLRYLRQLSATYMIYPAANHSRFEHSLGVYELGKRAFDSLCEDGEFEDELPDLQEVQRTFLAACLLHDVGHPPFSHVGETMLDSGVIKDRLEELGFVDRLNEADIGVGLNPRRPLEDASEHELLSCAVILGEFGEALSDEINVDPFEVCGYVLGFSFKAQERDEWRYDVVADLLHSAMDIDRLDYIIRDNFMTGASVLNVDTDRMVRAYTTSGESLVFSDKALSTIGNYLEGRVAVYMWVTQHHKSVYANALLRELLVELNEKMQDEEDEPLVSTRKILDVEIDDHYALQNLREYADAFPESRLASLYRRFRERDYMNSCWKHKVAYQNELDEQARDNFYERVDSNPKYVQRHLCEELGLQANELWVELSYVPNYRPSELRDVRVAYEGNDRSVTELGLYENKEIHGPTPYVFAPKSRHNEITTLINDEFA